ncbi:MAG: hypothetical protein ACTSW7_01430 [Candidatus Thorarchaeota archaeon]|nr:hypothetical protein [Thermoplasmatales archaeon]
MKLKIKILFSETDNERMAEILAKYGFTYIRTVREYSKYNFRGTHDIVGCDFEQEEVEYDFQSMKDFIQFAIAVGRIDIDDDTIYVEHF